MSDKTCCWKCNTYYPINFVKCSKCQATNENHVLQTAQNEAYAEGRKDEQENMAEELQAAITALANMAWINPTFTLHPDDFEALKKQSIAISAPHFFGGMNIVLDADAPRLPKNLKPSAYE